MTTRNVTKITMGQVVWGLEIQNFGLNVIALVGDGCSTDGKVLLVK